MVKKNFDFVAVFLVACGMLLVQEVPGMTRRVPVAFLRQAATQGTLQCDWPVRPVSVGLAGHALGLGPLPMPPRPPIFQ